LLPIASLALCYRHEARRASCASMVGSRSRPIRGVKVVRSLEQTVRGGLRFKQPKTRNSRRTITLPPSAVAMPPPTAAISLNSE